MARLSVALKVQLEQLLQMKHGYVLDFTNNTFADFVNESISVDPYHNRDGSKASVLRELWADLPPEMVAKLTLDMLEYRRAKELIGVASAEFDERDRESADRVESEMRRWLSSASHPPTETGAPADERSPGCPYELLGELGQGGMAVVYRGRRPGTRQEVAVKLPRPLAEDGIPRMKREISVQSGLSHSAIMPILDSNLEGEPWLAMPIADQRLRDVNGPLDSDEVLTIVRRLAEGLGYAHSLGLVHRDVSPNNILHLPERGWVVSDWGTVRRPLGATQTALTVSGAFGTLAYAAPEMQQGAHDVGPEVDVYSLGRVAARLLTGTEPVTNVQLLPRGPWRGVIFGATHENPSQRCRSMDDLLELIDTLLSPVALNPAAIMKGLLSVTNSAPPPSHEFWKLVFRERDDHDLMLDVVARVNPKSTAAWAFADPPHAADACVSMASHLVGGNWGSRDFNYAAVPLEWCFNVLLGLAQADAQGELEDAATEFFIASESWDRWKQNPKTQFWLQGLDHPVDGTIARALRRSKTVDFMRD